MEERIYDSELKILELIWEREPVSAKELSLLAAARLSWNKNTTYTVLKKIEVKGYIRRSDPGFICTSLVSREDIRRTEARGLVQKLFDGSRKALFSTLIQDEELSEDELEALQKLIEQR